MTGTVVALSLIFAQLSVVAFGGGNTVLPEMQRQVVDIHGWMSARDFAALYALAQAAPGPNMMVVPLVGWQVAGLPGLAVASAAKFGPSSMITGLALHAWERFRDRPWRGHVQAGLVPVTVGLVAASAALIVEATVHRAMLAGIAALSAAAT
jgi:chromate transporter